MAASAPPTAPATGAKPPPSQPAGGPKNSPMPNRAEEPDFKLEMPIDLVIFQCGGDERPVYCDVTIKNTTSDRQSFKVKCTSSDIFRVQPPIGFIKSGETQTIRVWFQNKQMPADVNRHYFAFYHLKAADPKQTGKQLWTKTVKPDGVRRLRAVFQQKKQASRENLDKRNKDVKVWNKHSTKAFAHSIAFCTNIWSLFFIWLK